MDGFDRIYETARALGEDTRFRIYRALWTAEEPASVSALAAAFDLHPNAIRMHLARLENAGLVVSRAERGEKAGRPRRVYQAAQEPIDFEHPPRTMRSLARVLAETVAALPADRRRLVSAGRDWVISAGAEQWGTPPRSRRGRADAFVRELRDWGWRPATRQRGGETRIRTRRCIFADLSPRLDRRCCALEEGMLRGMTEALLDGTGRIVRVSNCDLEVAV